MKVNKTIRYIIYAGSLSAIYGLNVVIASTILTDDKGLKYVDFTPSFSQQTAPCLPQSTIELPRETLVIDGVRRTYDYYIPPHLADKPAIVFAVHGSGMDSREMRKSTAAEFEQLADKYGFVVIYPNGFDGGWNDIRKSSPHTAKTLDLDEVAFFSQIISSEKQRLNIDPDKFFYFGISNGGQMILRLLISAPHLVTAATTFGTSLPLPAYSKYQYDNIVSKPVMFVHGKEDSVVPYKGGEIGQGFGAVYSSQETVSYWLNAVGLHNSPIKRHIGKEGDKTSIDILIWSEPDKNEIRLYSINGGGHVIPMPKFANMPNFCGGIDKPSHAMDSVYEAWAFWQQLKIPPAVNNN